jgi:hypothetical protein
MTHSLIAAAEALLHPERLFSVVELSTAPTLIPQEGGVYAWWFSKAPPDVPVDDTAVCDDRRLLYVGIAPRKPSAAGSVSSRTLRHRIFNPLPRPYSLIYTATNPRGPSGARAGAQHYPNRDAQALDAPGS